MHRSYVRRLQQARAVLMLVAVTCGPHRATRPAATCTIRPLTACRTGPDSFDVVRGHVAIGTTLCFQQQAAGCNASYVISDDTNLGAVTLNGLELGCTGPRGALCCPIDALHRDVVAHGTLHHDDRHQWIDVAEICAPAASAAP
jgi:hypothetical protein